MGKNKKKKSNKKPQQVAETVKEPEIQKVEDQPEAKPEKKIHQPEPKVSSHTYLEKKSYFIVRYKWPVLIQKFCSIFLNKKILFTIEITTHTINALLPSYW